MKLTEKNFTANLGAMVEELKEMPAHDAIQNVVQLIIESVGPADFASYIANAYADLMDRGKLKWNRPPG